ncbi:MAG: Ig-like domain-containing protein [Desulfuromonadaceae bacterium]|nr:Ig-like domain-containing protein [Desulfuromonadaceae bacterium]
MRNILWSGVMCLLLLSGCGWNGTPTRNNDFTPLTSITITPVYSTIAAGTSTTLTAVGNFSGLFTRDVTDQVVWSSGTAAVADFITAADKNRVTGSTSGHSILTATVGSVSATYTLTVSSAAITSLAITPVAPSKAQGLTTQFTAHGTFDDASTQDLTFDASWSSSDTAVATVTQGLAKGIAVGTATISATFGAKSDSTLLTVTAPVLQSIAVTPDNSTVSGISKTVNFIATGTYSNGTTADITAQAAWKSSQPSIASIVESSGVATTLTAGTTSISATMSGFTGKTNLTVTTAVLSSLKITPVGPVYMSVNGTQQLTVTATFNDSSTQIVTSSCVWASNPATYASVSSTGLVTGVASGTSTITATYSGQSESVNVTVH